MAGTPLPQRVPLLKDGTEAWQVPTASGHASFCGVPTPLALTGLATLLPTLLATPLPCPAAHSQHGEGTGPSASRVGSPATGLRRGRSWPGTRGRVPRAQICRRAVRGQAPLHALRGAEPGRERGCRS